MLKFLSFFASLQSAASNFYDAFDDMSQGYADMRNSVSSHQAFFPATFVHSHTCSCGNTTKVRWKIESAFLTRDLPVLVGLLCSPLESDWVLGEIYQNPMKPKPHVHHKEIIALNMRSMWSHKWAGFLRDLTRLPKWETFAVKSIKSGSQSCKFTQNLKILASGCPNSESQ